MSAKKKIETTDPIPIEETFVSPEPEVDEPLLLTETDTAESGEAETPSESAAPTAEPPPEKKKRAPRKKKEPEPDISSQSETVEPVESGDLPADKGFNEQTAMPPPAPAKRPVRKRVKPDDVLTIESGTEIETERSREETAWHEIHNAYRTRRILTGTLDGIEQNEAGKSIAIVHYNGFRVLIPLKEMMINLQNASGREYEDLMRRQNKIMGNMLGAEIDFVVKGIDSTTYSVVASRKDAMLKKRQMFYLKPDTSGQYRIYEGRVVQARVIAVADKVIRVEIFGVECSIMARDLSWDWMGDAHERFNIGDEILVRILSVTRNGLEDISVSADAKSVTENTSAENLKKCRVQGKYAGQVTDIHKGVVFIRLSNGVNAVAHSCYDRKMPGKKDDVSFVVTHIDDDRGVAVGIITRIIRQNL